MGLTVYDTLRRDKVAFETRDEGRVAMYVCGPTVYDDAHIGHGRAAVVFDVIRRYLEYRDYDVLFVQNITDIDDKIIDRASREEVSSFRIAEKFTRRWTRALDELGAKPPDVQPLATGHILEMHELIAKLVDTGVAYPADGNVLFRVRKFDDYGKLSGRKIDELQEGGDTVAGDVKEDPLDFALWKAAKPGEPAWPSPWGPGRPGWHIECSAMAAKHLGSGFDIHGGGMDLVFPHHENEIAQHQAAHGGTFSRYWIHNGMVQFGDEKMAKSVGNIVGLREAIERWGVGPLRMWYLSAHHRSPLGFDARRLADAVAAHERLVTFVRNSLGRAEPANGAADGHIQAFVAAMDDDFNASQAVAALHDLVSEGNDALAAGEAAQAAALAQGLVTLGDDVLGLAISDAAEARGAAGPALSALVQARLDARERARAAKDFAAADAIRDELDAAGVIVEDTVDGQRWHVSG